MASIIYKKSDVPRKVPSVSDLSSGELAINTHDGVIYAKNNNNEIIKFNKLPGYYEVNSFTDRNNLTSIKEGDYCYVKNVAFNHLEIYLGGKWYTTEIQEAPFHMTVTSTSTPQFDVAGGTITVFNNNNGTYSVYSWDPVTSVNFKDDPSSKDVTKVVVHRTDTLTTMDNIFYPSFSNAMTNLTEVIFEITCDTSSVTNMNWMFSGCSGLTSLDISSFNTSSVTNMNSMFYGCSGLTSLDVSNFDTSSITDMDSMFSGCSNIQWIYMPSDINTTQPSASMNKMFYNCSNLQCLDRLDTTNATGRIDMFYNCPNLIAPDSTAQADLTDSDGASWINSGTCP